MYIYVSKPSKSNINWTHADLNQSMVEKLHVTISRRRCFVVSMKQKFCFENTIKQSQTKQNWIGAIKRNENKIGCLYVQK